MFLRLLEIGSHGLVKRLHVFRGTSLWRDLKAMILDLLVISSSMFFQPSTLISGRRGESKLLPVTIWAARICNVELRQNTSS